MTAWLGCRKLTTTKSPQRRGSQYFTTFWGTRFFPAALDCSARDRLNHATRLFLKGALAGATDVQAASLKSLALCWLLNVSRGGSNSNRHVPLSDTTGRREGGKTLKENIKAQFRFLLGFFISTTKLLQFL